ncbi:hypothetical protein SK128_011042, partial [Halocaridina rubra]
MEAGGDWLYILHGPVSETRKEQTVDLKQGDSEMRNKVSFEKKSPMTSPAKPSMGRGRGIKVISPGNRNSQQNAQGRGKGTNRGPSNTVNRSPQKTGSKTASPQGNTGKTKQGENQENAEDFCEKTSPFSTASKPGLGRGRGTTVKNSEEKRMCGQRVKGRGKEDDQSLAKAVDSNTADA